MNYGLPPLSGKLVSSLEHGASWSRILQDAIMRFEPRILPQTLTVRGIPAMDAVDHHNVCPFEITGDALGAALPAGAPAQDRHGSRERRGPDRRGALMDPRMLRYYSQELQYMREMGAEFAARVPQDRRAAGARRDRGGRSVRRATAGRVQLPLRAGPAEARRRVPALHAAPARRGVSALSGAHAGDGDRAVHPHP